MKTYRVKYVYYLGVSFSFSRDVKKLLYDINLFLKYNFNLAIT